MYELIRPHVTPLRALGGLVWKEWRSHRAVAAIFTLGGALFLAVTTLVTTPSQQLQLLPMAVWITAVYALAMAATTVSEESEEGTVQLLEALGASRFQLLVAKGTWLLSTTLLIGLLLTAAATGAGLLKHGPSASEPVWLQPLAGAQLPGVMVVVEAALWGYVGACLARRVTHAIVLAGVAWVATALIVRYAFDPRTGWPEFAVACAAVVVAHLAPDLFRARRGVWLRLDGIARSVTRLVWLELRDTPAALQLITLFVLMVVLAAAPLVLARSYGLEGLRLGAIGLLLHLYLAAVGLGCGIAVWRYEHSARSFQLLRDHGVSANLVIAVRMGWWALVTALLTLPAVAAGSLLFERSLPALWTPRQGSLPVLNPLHLQQVRFVNVGGHVAAAAIAFAAALLSVSAVRRPVFATCLALPLAGAELLIFEFAAAYRVPLLPLAIGPAVLWIAVAAFCSAAWYYERPRRRYGIAVLVALVLGLWWQYAIYASYRVARVPRRAEPLLEELFGEPVSPAETAQTAAAARVDRTAREVLDRLGLDWTLPPEAQFPEELLARYRQLRAQRAVLQRLARGLAEAEEARTEPGLSPELWLPVLELEFVTSWLDGEFDTALTALSALLYLQECELLRPTGDIDTVARQRLMLYHRIAALSGSAVASDHVLQKLQTVLYRRRWHRSTVRRAMVQAAKWLYPYLVRRPRLMLPCERQRWQAVTAAAAVHAIAYAEEVIFNWPEHGEGRRRLLSALWTSLPEQVFGASVPPEVPELCQLLLVERVVNAESLNTEELYDLGLQFSLWRRLVERVWLTERACRVLIAGVGVRRAVRHDRRVAQEIAALPLPQEAVSWVRWDTHLSVEGIAPRAASLTLPFGLVLGKPGQRMVAMGAPVVWAAGWPARGGKLIVYTRDGRPLWHAPGPQRRPVASVAWPLELRVCP